MIDLKRIRKIINWLIFSEYSENEAGIAQKLGYTKSSFSQIINGKVPISEKFIDKLCEADENINKVWIIEGIGEMLKSNETFNTKESPQIEYNRNPRHEPMTNDERIDALIRQNDVLAQSVQDVVKMAHETVSASQRQSEANQEIMKQLLSILEDSKKNLRAGGAQDVAVRRAAHG